MGAFSRVNPGNEPRADGYLRGQVWNRPTTKTADFLGFRIWNPWESTGRYGAAEPSYYYEREMEPGYYTDSDSLLGLYLPWQRQQAGVYKPYYLPEGTYRSMPEGAIVRVQGYNSLPDPLPIGSVTSLAVDWTASAPVRSPSPLNNFYGQPGNSSYSDIFLHLKALPIFDYYVVEFTAEVFFPLTPPMTNDIGSMSAFLIDTDTPALLPEDRYPPEATKELAKWGDPVFYLSGRDNYRHLLSDGIRRVTVFAFVYEAGSSTGYWVPQYASITYPGF